MVYIAPREPASLALALQRQRDTRDAYLATVHALPQRERDAIQRYVSAVRDEAAARRAQVRDERGRR